MERSESDMHELIRAAVQVVTNATACSVVNDATRHSTYKELLDAASTFLKQQFQAVSE